MKMPRSKEYPLGVRINLVDEYVNRNKDAPHYRDVIQSKKYLINRHYCDPSGKTRDAGLSSWIDKLSFNEKTGRRDWHFEYTHAYGRAEMIDQANDYIPAVRLNRHQCPHHYAMFTRWMYRTDRDGKVIKPPVPEHDDYSHPGTEFYYFIINRFPPRRRGTKAVLK
jgi:hypothetical protein